MYENLKEKVLKENLRLVALDLVIFTWGNVSEFDRDHGVIAIKPSGVEYDVMKTEDIVLVDLDGNVIDGQLKPSSDLATHLEIYRAFPEVNGIVHTHSRWATAYAQAGCDLPALGTTHADYFYGDIPCTRLMTEEEIHGDYEKETGKVIIEAFRDRGLQPMDIPAVLVHSHGPFAWGKDAADAVYHAKVLEEDAMMAALALSINPKLGRMQQALLDKHYLRKHGKGAYYGQG
ncbi:MAG: L-ribulose-5-phosphate 4-epimerase [Peptoniphilaceae bacterium]|nr:L-ribulose-5-phosphate 4-epimerase [Peptoniphilaceae bacterium]MDD7542939.1 L-ribulose-5-phosphate 4-epimerase [Peptoniphilaceae bacterium]MDY3075150.1 L-ribulose-5-phosphate 4-epimerase [Peptoniphilaceae bacterium]MDY5766088.1 L-ribulose-5-phosphate 4-epimerase [Peptoniphilaceae bacterium]